MFLLDDILMAPMKGLYTVFNELHKAAEAEKANEADTIRNKLSELYMLLETGQLAEAEFDDQERELLDRLDELEAEGAGEDEGDEDEEDMMEEDEEEDEDEEEEEEEEEAEEFEEVA